MTTQQMQAFAEMKGFVMVQRRPRFQYQVMDAAGRDVFNADTLREVYAWLRPWPIVKSDTAASGDRPQEDR